MDDKNKLDRELKTENALIKPLTVNELHTMQRCVRHLLINEETDSIFNKHLRKKLGPKPNEIVKAGFHFDDQLLIKAFNKYHEKFDDFEGFNSLKNILFWRQIIGFIQRYLTVCTAQAFCQGLYDVVYDNKKLKRSGEIIDFVSVHFFQLSSMSGLGIEYAVRWAGYGVSGFCVAGPRTSFIETYINQKQQYFDNLFPSAVSQTLQNRV